MGLDAERVSKEEVDALFDSFDPDGSGSINYNELNKALRRRGAELAPRNNGGRVAAKAVSFPAKLKSKRKTEGKDMIRDELDRRDE